MSWTRGRDLLQRALLVYQLATADRVTGEAAKVVFYFFLALFPLVIVLFAFTGIVGGHEAFEWVMSQLRAVLPDAAAAWLASFVREGCHRCRSTAR